MEPVLISWWQLALTLVFVLVAGATSLFWSLGLVKDLVVGTVRTFTQLFLLGFVLTFLFEYDSPWLVLAAFMAMVFFAAVTILGRIREKRISLFHPIFLSMLVSYAAVSYLVTGVIVGADPWWMPQYLLPLAGMVVGNSMNAIAIALDRLFSDLRSRRAEVEMKLCLGADYREASQDILVGAMRAGMIPSINALMAVGLVFIPGMMSGQILAGVDPMASIRYQIVVMLMLVASTTMGTLLVVLLIRRRCFGPGDGLVLRARNGQ